MNYFAKIDLTLSALLSRKSFDDFKNISEHIKESVKSVEVNDADEDHAKLYSYITKDQYSRLERAENGYWICPYTGLSGTLHMLDKVWEK